MADPRYPHMMPEDLPVWDRWLQAQTPDWESIRYDVKVGAGAEIRTDYPEPYRTSAIMLSKKRIDAVIIYPDRHIIVEVKKFADWKALGQLMGYPILYQTHEQPTVPVMPLLIAESMSLDLGGLLDHYNIPYELIGPPEPQRTTYTGEPL